MIAPHDSATINNPKMILKTIKGLLSTGLKRAFVLRLLNFEYLELNAQIETN